MENLTGSEFDSKALKAEKPVLVDFYADWCGPCKIMGPILEELSDQYKDKMDFYRYDVDSDNSIPQRYEIMSIPTMIVFKNGAEAGKLIGAQPKKAVETLIESNI